jgi:hypothetical protein
MLALLIHLVPTFVFIAALILAWRWEWIGAVIFTFLGIFYLVWTWGRFDWIAYAFITGPLVLMGILFLYSWIYRAELRTA